jgi:peptidoglycan/LPS O-acetylase OafA/YrhL
VLSQVAWNPVSRLGVSDGATNVDSPAFRTDIQALRGLAILLVVLHHSKLVNGLVAGYLGVDIFFVVSGYLITGVVVKGIKQGTFTFSGFYFRRAKRLLPAAYVTFLATTLLSPLFLTRPEMRDFAWQLFGAVTFTGNIALWMQTGYFEGAAELKPLLHVWSLSIEEQYYLLLPAALVFTLPRFWRAGTLAVLAGSLALCLLLVSVKPGATFYLLPTRAWELALGSLGVLALDGGRGLWLARLFWPALAVLVMVPFFPTGGPHPGLDALIVCTATLIVILRRHPLLERSHPVRGLAGLGDMSYSLYLVHWPLLALAANAWVSPVPGAVRIGLVFAALVLSYALFRWVERPARRAEIPFNRKSLMMALGTSAGVVLTGFLVYHAGAEGGRVDYAYVRRVNHGLSLACDFGDRFEPKSDCQDSDAPRILVWGDSFAMHLVEGIAAAPGSGLVQATKSACGPFMGISSFSADGLYNRKWAEGCLSFNQSVLEYLANAASVEVVVLSGTFSQPLAGNRLIATVGGSASGSRAVRTEQKGGENIGVDSLRATIAAVRALGKRVVLIAPPPTSGFNIGRCLELKANGRAIVGADNPSCSISKTRYYTFQADVLALLDRVAVEADVPVIRLDDFLCQGEACAAEMDGTFIYRDGGHLSYDGSRLLGQRMGLASQVMAIAR